MFCKLGKKMSDRDIKTWTANFEETRATISQFPFSIADCSNQLKCEIASVSVTEVCATTVPARASATSG